MGARDRLAEWMDDEGLSQTGAAERLDCSQTLISKLLRGDRTPGRTLAHRISDETQGWAKKGPITSREWDADEAEAKSALAATGS